MRKYGKRCLCFLLALAMVLSNVSVGSVAYASELETVDSAKESEKDSTSSDVPEEETEADAEKSENEDDDKSDESPADEKDGESSENTAEDTQLRSWTSMEDRQPRIPMERLWMRSIFQKKDIVKMSKM